MTISQVIKFEGSPDDLVWKYSGEEFNATSQLIVDETHEAIIVVNGQAADTFGAGRHTLTVPTIPIASRIINIPTGSTSPFPCKVFYINKVHQMDILWGTRGAITLDDPLYDIFLHVMLHGSMSFSLTEPRKFLIKLAGFRSRYTNQEMIDSFRGIISSNVKDCISKIMINGMLSYFMINANLFDISEVVKERLDEVFEEYGIRVEFFNIEAIEVPKEDYEAVTKAKERRSGRIIEGYTWQEERQMMIAEKFAGNEGTMGNIGGAVGGFMMGGAMSGSIVDIARIALDASRIPDSPPPRNTSDTPKPWNPHSGGFDVRGFMSVPSQTNSAPAPQPVHRNVPQGEDTGSVCPSCGKSVVPGSKFCNECGTKLEVTAFCPECGTKVVPGSKFCNQCGFKLI